MSYLTKKLTVEAFQFAGFQDRPEWVRNVTTFSSAVWEDRHFSPAVLYMVTDSNKRVGIGDWIVRLPDGAVEAVSNRNFSRLYKEKREKVYDTSIPYVPDVEEATEASDNANALLLIQVSTVELENEIKRRKVAELENEMEELGHRLERLKEGEV